MIEGFYCSQQIKEFLQAPSFTPHQTLSVAAGDIGKKGGEGERAFRFSDEYCFCGRKKCTYEQKNIKHHY